MSHDDHGFCVGAVALLIIVGLGLNMENNQSYLMYVPRKEFTRVISDIVSGGGRATSSNDAGNEEEVEDDNDNMVFEVKESPRTLAMRTAQLKKASDAKNLATMRKKAYVKSDSLYYLQRNLEEREAKLQLDISKRLTSSNDRQESDKGSNQRRNYYGKEDFFSSDTEEEDDDDQ
jgi:hypothetical protein